MTLELPPLRIWQHKRNRLWYVGMDRTIAASAHPSSIDAFMHVRDVCRRNDYRRRVVLESRTGEEVETRVGP